MRARDLAKIGFFSGKGGSGGSGGGGKLYHHSVKIDTQYYSGDGQAYDMTICTVKFFSSDKTPITSIDNVPLDRVYNLPQYVGQWICPIDGEIANDHCMIYEMQNANSQINFNIYGLADWGNVMGEYNDYAYKNRLTLVDTVTEV